VVWNEPQEEIVSVVTMSKLVTLAVIEAVLCIYFVAYLGLCSCQLDYLGF
jgi:hypothetical protein